MYIYIYIYIYIYTHTHTHKWFRASNFNLAVLIKILKKEQNILFNDAFSKSCLQFCGVKHNIKDNSERKPAADAAWAIQLASSDILYAPVVENRCNGSTGSPRGINLMSKCTNRGH